MIKKLTLDITPQNAGDLIFIKAQVAQKLKVTLKDIWGLKIVKKSLDARSKLGVKVQLQLEVALGEKLAEETPFELPFKNISQSSEVHIIGAGPAGLFAALQLIQKGYKPVIIERGKDVRERRRDLALLNKEGNLNSESNYCFGEGGAGTYSDGKLYTRSTKRGDVKWILKTLVYFGATPEILIDTHPHIGTNKLPQIIIAIRAYIQACGGEIHFQKKLTDICLTSDEISHIICNENEKIKVHKLILATGHSANDIYELLAQKNIALESKPFALGVRIEHPQNTIDSAQYHCPSRGDFLPPASYSLVTQTNGRGVFSFCMCPGGIIATAATSEGALVVNGWSPSKRNNPYANSGIVVTVTENDYKKQGFSGVLSGLHFRTMIEQKAYQSGGGKFVAPAQRVLDFTQNKISTQLPKCSYIPGVKSALIHEILPQEINESIIYGLQYFNRKIKGFISNDALIVAPESRTSAPVRIPRHEVDLTHPQYKNLYPCAEGAGYAGGIISAAIDGMRCAEMIAKSVF